MMAAFRGLTILALCLALMPLAALADGDGQRTYKVAVDAEFAPFEFTSMDGSVRGIAPDILRAIGESAGISFELMPMTWDQAVMALNADRIDLLQMMRTEKRARRYAFSEPFIALTQALFCNRRHPEIRNLAAIAGKRIALQKHDITAEMLAGRDDFQRVFVGSKHQGFELLQMGYVDGFFAAELPGQDILQTSHYPDVEIAIGGLFSRPLSFAGQKANSELIALLNRGLAQLKASGRLEQIVQRKGEKKPGGSLVWIAGLTALLTLPGILLLLRRNRGAD